MERKVKRNKKKKEEFRKVDSSSAMESNDAWKRAERRESEKKKLAGRGIYDQWRRAKRRKKRKKTKLASVGGREGHGRGTEKVGKTGE